MPWLGLNEGESLGTDECWRLLGSCTLGRLCLDTGERVHVALTPYVVRERRVCFRAVAFGLVARHVLTRPVTFQADDVHDDGGAAWAVTATGGAAHVSDPATLAALWTPVRPPTWSVRPESVWIALTPDDVRGQRLGV